MNHSTLAGGQKYNYSQCCHGKGRCLDHEPEWENIGKKRLEPNPGYVIKVYYCCNERMARYKEIQTRRCQKCGRTEDNITHYYIAFCLCCGEKFPVCSVAI